MAFRGYDWFLIVVAVVVSLLAIGVALYVLIAFQHPEDRNQAWIPKIVVVFGIALAIWTVLLFPLDVGNRNACSQGVAFSKCRLSIPTRQLWYACYGCIGGMVAVVIPFSVFYYEADSELSANKRVRNAFLWSGLTVLCFGVVFGLAYGFAGYMTYNVTSVSSGMAPLADLAVGNSTILQSCIFPGTGPQGPRYTGLLCDAVNGQTVSDTWTQRSSLLTYFMALSALLGWFLFFVFGGVGFVALPMDLVREWWSRPRATILKSEFLVRAMDMARKAKSVQDKAAVLKDDERVGGRNRKWRARLAQLNLMMTILESDQDQLDKVYPQGSDPDYMWAVTVMMYWVKLAAGILSGGLSVLWLVHVVVYVLLSPPLHPFLNDFFSKMDDVFPLFGTLAFSICCFYLIVVTLKGVIKVGLNLIVTSFHPMRRGATVMSSILFNVALVLVACLAVIQFCAQAFSLYAYETAIYDIFSNQGLNLLGIGWLYQQRVFLYGLLGMVGLSLICFFIKGPEPFKRRGNEAAWK